MSYVGPYVLFGIYNDIFIEIAVLYGRIISFLVKMTFLPLWP